MAARIAGDGRYINSLDYVDDNAETLARKKMKSEVMKKAFAVQGKASILSCHHMPCSPTQLIIMYIHRMTRLRSDKEGAGFVCCSVHFIPFLPFELRDEGRLHRPPSLYSCNLCFTDSGGPPRAAVVALGTRTYLGLMENEELVKGHCRIVPIQHHFSSLEAEDETWDEIKVS